MGRFSGLSMALSNVADKLRKEREMGAETGQKINLLGYAASLEGWKPKTQEQALAFEKAKSGVSEWDIQKEARTTVNAMINQNPVLQAQVFQNPKLVTDLIDKEAERLSGKYRGGGITPTTTPKPVISPEPAISPPTFTPPKITTPVEERILVIDPATKQKGTIPKSQLQDALKAGFKRTIK